MFTLQISHRISKIWLSHVTPNMIESCHTYACNPWMSMSLSRGDHTLTHIWMNHITHMNESCHSYGCHIWTSHVSIARRFHGRRTSGMKETYKRWKRPIKGTYICMQRVLTYICVWKDVSTARRSHGRRTSGMKETYKRWKRPIKDERDLEKMSPPRGDPTGGGHRG